MMKNFFRLLALGLALCVCVSLFFSCSAPEKNESSSSSAPASTPNSEAVSKAPGRFDHDENGKYGLPTDDMPRLTKPVVTGDFIQIWYCGYWDKEQWMTHLSQLKEAGITTLIIQTTFNVSGTKIDSIAFEHDLGSDVISANCSQNTAFLGNLLSYIKEAGMTLWIGLGMNDAWWDSEINDVEWCLAEAEFNNLAMNEIKKHYFDEYRDQIEGFYWPYEMYVQNAGLEDNWSAMLNKNLDYLTALDSSVPLMLCPYISEWYVTDYEIKPEDDALVWKKLIDNTRFRDGDIFCPQDCMATVDIPLEETVKFLMGMKAAVDGSDADMEFWLDMENYNSGNLNNFIAQLDIGSRLAEGMVCFSYSHYYAPTSGKGGLSHKGYCQYAKGYGAVSEEA